VYLLVLLLVALDALLFWVVVAFAADSFVSVGKLLSESMFRICRVPSRLNSDLIGGRSEYAQSFLGIN
jgi:hypothetical protein